MSHACPPGQWAEGERTKGFIPSRVFRRTYSVGYIPSTVSLRAIFVPVPNEVTGGRESVPCIAMMNRIGASE